MDKKELLRNVFGYKDPQPAQAPTPTQLAPLPPPPPQMERDIVDPQVSAKVQGKVWNKQAPQGPKGVVQGQTASMKQTSGWGQV
jgi:hypothetical protein